jgi:hypothetical protein
VVPGTAFPGDPFIHDTITRVELTEDGTGTIEDIGLRRAPGGRVRDSLAESESSARRVERQPPGESGQKVVNRDGEDVVF